MLASIRAGLAYARRTPPITALLIIVLTQLPGSFVLPLIPTYARDILGVGVTGFGTLTALHAAGFLTGFVLLSLGDIPKKGLVLVATGIMWDASMVAFGFSRVFPLSAALLFVMGVMGGVHMNTLTTLVQLSAEPHMRGRVLGPVPPGVRGLALGIDRGRRVGVGGRQRSRPRHRHGAVHASAAACVRALPSAPAALGPRGNWPARIEEAVAILHGDSHAAAYGRRSPSPLPAARSPVRTDLGWTYRRAYALTDAIEFREVDGNRWGDLERLFESRGGPQVLLVHGGGAPCRQAHPAPTAAPRRMRCGGASKRARPSAYWVILTERPSRDANSAARELSRARRPRGRAGKRLVHRSASSFPAGCGGRG